MALDDLIAMPSRVLPLLGSITIAVPLLIVIAAVLAWGTIYETRFGTAAVQRFIYTAWWFQALLAFLALNLAMAALQRYPWQRKHVPFLLAHLGIILILVGGIIGGRFGMEGQLVIPEGRAERILLLPGKVLVVHRPNPGVHQIVPTSFETQAWVHEPNTTFSVPLAGRTIELTVDRYYPDAVVHETITGDGEELSPAVHLLLEHAGQQDARWLLSRDPERFGMGWGEAHLVFLEPSSEEQVAQLIRPPIAAHPRGVVRVTFPEEERAHEIPVPSPLHQTVEIDGTPYRITFRDYFPDFAMTEQGLVSRSEQPNNPAVSFVLSGPHGTDPYLLFAFHPEAQTLHGWGHPIAAEVEYTHPAGTALPPNAMVLLRLPSGNLSALLTGPTGQLQRIDPLEVGVAYRHPWLDYQFTVAASYPRAKVVQDVVNRSDAVRAEALHLIAREGDEVAEAWLGRGEPVELAIGEEPLVVEYRPGQRPLPFTVKLLDFRKIDYPGTQMAAGFESDVELTDPERGLILMRTIQMNEPLKYRGFSLFQSSYIPGPPRRAGAGEGPVETTVLSVRKDPGTPLVYAGSLVLVLGILGMFVSRSDRARATRPRRSGAHH